MKISLYRQGYQRVETDQIVVTLAIPRHLLELIILVLLNQDQEPEKDQQETLALIFYTSYTIFSHTFYLQYNHFNLSFNLSYLSNDNDIPTDIHSMTLKKNFATRRQVGFQYEFYGLKPTLA